ncbi:MAG: Gfo/Idh/MocA family protein [Ilumatobacteraceae bacterium]
MRGELPGFIGGRPLGIGIVGAGFIGAVHARAARRAGARVVGVSASSPESTHDAVERLGAGTGFTDSGALIASPDVDVVHICTPNNLHHDLAAGVLAVGKHVVCEKPLVIDPSQGGDLCAAAALAGVVATVPFVYRFYPMVREARARVAGQFAPVRLIHGHYLQDWLSTEHDDNWRVDVTTSGSSRAFADIGSHWCDLVEFVTGDRLASVCAELVTVVPERVTGGEHVHAFQSGSLAEGSRRPVATEDVALVLFRTVGGVTGSVVVSQVSSGHKNQLRFEITGADASIAFDQERPDTLWVGRRAASEIVERDPAALDPSAAAYVTVPPGHPQGYQDCFDAFVADTYRAIAAGSADAVEGLPTFADGARAARVTAAVLHSASTHRWEDIPAVGATHHRSKEGAS